MKIRNFLHARTTLYHATVDSKKAILETISRLASEQEQALQYKDLLDCLLNREKLGSTAIGHGVAIPHGRIANISEPLGILVSTVKSIDFDALDNEPVDLFFGLFVPENENQHLEILAEIAGKFSHQGYRQKLRHANNTQELYELAVDE